MGLFVQNKYLKTPNSKTMVLRYRIRAEISRREGFAHGRGRAHIDTVGEPGLGQVLETLERQPMDRLAWGTASDLITAGGLDAFDAVARRFEETRNYGLGMSLLLTRVHGEALPIMEHIGDKIMPVRENPGTLALRAMLDPKRAAHDRIWWHIADVNRDQHIPPQTLARKLIPMDYPAHLLPIQQRNWVHMRDIVAETPELDNLPQSVDTLTGFRDVSVQETHDRILPLITDVIGLRRDNLHFHYFNAHLHTMDWTDHTMVSFDGVDYEMDSPATNTGKGFDPVEAFVSAGMETIERWCSRMGVGEN